MNTNSLISICLSPLLLTGVSQGKTEDFSNHSMGNFTTLKSSLGEFSTQFGEASISKKSADNSKGSLKINGGSEKSIVLTLDAAYQKPLLSMRFCGERWTRAKPFEFSITAKQGGQDNQWKQIYNGNKLPLKQLSKVIHVDLKSKNYTAFKFTSTTKEGSGVILDNITLIPDGDMEIKSLNTKEHQIPVLVRGSKAPLLTINLETEGSKKPDQINEVVISTFGTTDLADVSSFTLYAGKNGSTDPKQSVPLGSLPPAKKLTFKIKHSLDSGTNSLFLIAKLSDHVNLSHRIHLTLTTIKLAKGGQLRPTDASTITAQRVGFNVATGGDEVIRTDGSTMTCKRMRIPGMATTNKGTLLAVYDLRWKQNGDLPGDIDVGLSRSTDGGQTWEAPRPILDMGEWLGEPQNKNGVGDPAILVDHKTGHIFVSGLLAHGLSSGWYWGKSQPGMDPKKTGQVVIVKSEDDGKTWSKPRNISSEIKDPAWQLMLQGPGAGISTRDGSLVFAFQYKENIGTQTKPKYSARSSIMYSKDHGKSWKVAPGIDYPQETTEAQVVELNDGSLMLNCRISAGGRAVFTTKNLGQSWEKHPTSGRGTFNMTGCMASILRYSSTKDGDEQDILLFSGPADGGKKRRTHMSIRYSLNEGKTWSSPYLLDELGGAYSCLALVGKGKDKDIGIIYEGSQSNMTFERLTLKELIGK